MRICARGVLFALLVSATAGAGNHLSSNAGSMERKLRHLDANGALPRPDPAPTVFTEGEVNAYLASGLVSLPAGVQSVRLQGAPGIVTANTRVDFDRLKGRTNSYNPLLAIFTGVHDVVVIAHAHGSGAEGFVHVDSVSFDQIEIPRFALQLFAEKYLQPQYPGIDLDSRFPLPDRIANATVGEHELTVEQR